MLCREVICVDCNVAGGMSVLCAQGAEFPNVKCGDTCNDRSILKCRLTQRNAWHFFAAARSILETLTRRYGGVICLLIDWNDYDFPLSKLNQSAYRKMPVMFQ